MNRLKSVVVAAVAFATMFVTGSTWADAPVPTAIWVQNEFEWDVAQGGLTLVNHGHTIDSGLIKIEDAGGYGVQIRPSENYNMFSLLVKYSDFAPQSSDGTIIAVARNSGAGNRIGVYADSTGTKLRKIIGNVMQEESGETTGVLPAAGEFCFVYDKDNSKIRLFARADGESAFTQLYEFSDNNSQKDTILIGGVRENGGSGAHGVTGGTPMNPVGMKISGIAVFNGTVLTADSAGEYVWPTPTEAATATISEDTNWSDIEWDDVVPDGNTPVEFTFTGDWALTLDDAAVGRSFLIKGVSEAEQAIKIVGSAENVAAFAVRVKLDSTFTGSVTYEIDATEGFVASEAFLGRIKNATGQEKFVFNGAGEYGVALNFGETTDPIKCHLVFDGGEHSMNYYRRASGQDKPFGQNGSLENPTILVKGETTLDFTAKDISYWNGAVDISGVVRVNEGGVLNLLQNGTDTMFFRQRLCIDPGALVTFTCDKADNGESRFRWQGGAVQGKEQIYVPASDEDATDKPAILRQVGTGGFLLATDNTRGCAIFVGENSKLIFDCSVTELGSNNAVLAKYGAGEFEIAAGHEPEEGFAADFSAQEGIVSLVNGPVFRNFTASNKVTYRFAEGTEKGDAVGLCTGTLDAPGRVMDVNVYVGDQLEEGVSLVYDAEGKSVAYADAIGEIELYDNIISVSDINTAFESQGLTGEQPVRLFLRAEGAIELVLDTELRAEITDLYVAQDYNGNILLTPVDEVDYYDVLYPFDFSAVKGLLKYGWVKYAGAKVIAVNFNRKGFDNNDANGNDNNIIGDNEDSEALDCNIPGKDFLQVDARSSDWTSDAFVVDTATDEKIESSELQVKWSSNNNYRWSSDLVTKLIRGYLDDGGSHAQFSAKGIPFKGYDVIIYFATDQADRAFSPVTVNGKSYCWDSQAEKTVVGTTTWGASHNYAPAYGVNALCIEKCMGDLTVVGGANANNARGGIAAIVIVENNNVKKQEISTSSIADANENLDPTADIVEIHPTDGALVVDTAPAINYTVRGTGALKLQDSPDHPLTAEDLAKLQFEGFDKIIWDNSWVSGEACWMDYEFDGNLSNVGSDKTALKRDQDGGKFIYGDPATNDFRCVGKDLDGNDVFDALYAGSHPYRGVSWKESFTCAMFGTLPQVDYSALLAFGSTTDGTTGGIALMTGKVSENQVLLVKWTGDNHYVTMAEMSVPNAYDNSHLYVFTKNGREVKVYLDGTLWTTYTSETDFAMGNGFQICSVHGGSFSTGINRFTPADLADVLEDPRSYKCVIEALRLYDGEIGENAIAALVEEFPYECPNGNYSRTFSGEENWVAENTWSDGEGNFANEPADGSKVTIGAAEAATILVNLEEAKSYESITFNGEVTVKKGGEIPAVNAGLTTVNAPITIEAGAMTIAGGPTRLGEEGAIAFDYSKVDLIAFVGGFVQLTGSIEPSEKVTCDFIEEGTYYTASFGYDAASSTYRITVVAKGRTEGTEIYLADATETMNLIDETRFVDANGAIIPRIAADTIVIDTETLATLNINTALTVPLSKIVTKQDLAINFGNVNSLAEIEVAAGTLKTSSAYTGKIVIDEGATYDVDSKDNWTADFVMNGGTLANTGNPTAYDHVQVYKIDFTANSTINAASAIMSIASGWNQFDYKLNGKTLTKTGGGEYLISKGNFIGGGTVIVNEGVFTLDAFTIPEETTLTVSVPNGATFTVMDNKSHGFAKNGSLQFYGNNAIVDIKKSVTFDVFSTTGTPTIKLANGAVLTATTFAYNNESFTLDLSALTLGEEPITLINAPNIDTSDITLVLPAGVTDYELTYEDNVLKLIKSEPQANGTMIFLR